MADGRRRDEWERTSYQIAVAINAAGTKGKAVRPHEVDAFLIAERERDCPVHVRKPSELDTF